VVREMLGAVDRSVVLRLLEQASADGTGPLMAAAADALTQVADVDALFEEMLAVLHRLALVQALGPLEPEEAGLVELAAALSAEDLQLWYQFVVTARRDLPVIGDGRAALDMLLLRMQLFRDAAMAVAPAPAAASVQQTLPTALPKQSPTAHSAAVAEAVAPVKKSRSEAIPGAEPQQLATNADWLRCFPQLALGGIMQSVFAHAALERAEPGRAVFCLGAAGAALYDPAQQSRLAEALTKAIGLQLDVQVALQEPVVLTPARQEAETLATRLAAAKRALQEDPAVQLLIQRFDGRLQTDSITLTENS